MKSLETMQKFAIAILFVCSVFYETGGKTLCQAGQRFPGAPPESQALVAVEQGVDQGVVKKIRSTVRFD